MPHPTANQRYYQSILPLQGTQPRFFALGLRGWIGTVGVASMVVVLGILIGQLDGFATLGHGLVGVGTGSLLRDIGVRRAYLATWPLLDAVLDWDAVRDKAGTAKPD